MELKIFGGPDAVARQAAELTACRILDAVNLRGEARITLAAGATQITFLRRLVQLDLPWDRITFFHLDEYLGLSTSQTSCFGYFFEKHLLSVLPTRPRAFNFIAGDAPNPAEECDRLESLVRVAPIDLALLGIGENGHIAFNDPPADFKTKRAFLVVELEQRCREQQMKLGTFENLTEVPKYAITMSVPQIMASEAIVCLATGASKRMAVDRLLGDEISPLLPASVLRDHRNCHLLLDLDAANIQVQSEW